MYYLYLSLFLYCLKVIMTVFKNFRIYKLTKTYLESFLVFKSISIYFNSFTTYKGFATLIKIFTILIKLWSSFSITLPLFLVVVTPILCCYPQSEVEKILQYYDFEGNFIVALLTSFFFLKTLFMIGCMVLLIQILLNQKQNLLFLRMFLMKNFLKRTPV